MQHSHMVAPYALARDAVTFLAEAPVTRSTHSVAAANNMISCLLLAIVACQASSFVVRTAATEVVCKATTST